MRGDAGAATLLADAYRDAGDEEGAAWVKSLAADIAERAAQKAEFEEAVRTCQSLVAEFPELTVNRLLNLFDVDPGFLPDGPESTPMEVLRVAIMQYGKAEVIAQLDADVEPLECDRCDQDYWPVTVFLQTGQRLLCSKCFGR